MWEAIAAIAGLLTAAFAFTTKIMNKYYKQAEELEKIKKKNSDLVIGDLKETVNEHKIELRKIKTALDASNSIQMQTNKEINALTNDLQGLTHASELRIQRIETQIIKLTEDLLLVKGRPGAKNK